MGNASDLYWHAPEHGIGDFVRLRRTPDGAQITMKATDREDITNRVEIDLEVEDFKQAKALMTALHGDPVEKVKKKYYVYFLENLDTTISVYKVSGDDMVFVEVEARSKRRVKELVKKLTTADDGIKYDWIGSSLYNIYVNKDKIVSKPIEDYMETF